MKKVRDAEDTLKMTSQCIKNGKIYVYIAEMQHTPRVGTQKIQI